MVFSLKPKDHIDFVTFVFFIESLTLFFSDTFYKENYKFLQWSMRDEETVFSL